jgi:hypothetical protein
VKEMHKIEPAIDVTRIQIAICFVVTCCIPVPNVWADGSLAPLATYYLGLISPLTAPPFVLLLIAHLFLCRFVTRLFVEQVRARRISVNDKSTDEETILPPK